MGRVRWKIFIQHTISATLPSTYQNLSKLVEIWRSSDKNKNAVFLRHGVYTVNLRNKCYHQTSTAQKHITSHIFKSSAEHDILIPSSSIFARCTSSICQFANWPNFSQYLTVWSQLLVVWLSGNALVSINVVTLGLVSAWMGDRAGKPCQ